MGVYKWQQLGKVYPLEGVQSPTDHEVGRAIQLIEEGRESKKQKKSSLHEQMISMI